jgi:hypothetical protein
MKAHGLLAAEAPQDLLHRGFQVVVPEEAKDAPQNIETRTREPQETSADIGLTPQK